MQADRRAAIRAIIGVSEGGGLLSWWVWVLVWVLILMLLLTLTAPPLLLLLLLLPMGPPPLLPAAPSFSLVPAAVRETNDGLLLLVGSTRRGRGEECPLFFTSLPSRPLKLLPFSGDGGVWGDVGVGGGGVCGGVCDNGS